MKRQLITFCLIALIGSLSAYSKTADYEQAYVNEHEGRVGVPVPVEVVRPQLKDAPSDLKIDVLVTVDSKGKVLGAEVLDSTDSRYNTLVKNAAKRWKFRPLSEESVSDTVKVLIPFVSELEAPAIAMN